MIVKLNIICDERLWINNYLSLWNYYGFVSACTHVTTIIYYILYYIIIQCTLKLHYMNNINEIGQDFKKKTLNLQEIF